MKNYIQMKNCLFIIGLFLFAFQAEAQSYVFGLKGGSSIGFQNWQGQEKDPLYKYHGSIYIESLPVENSFALFAQAGYHSRGSATRYKNYYTSGITIQRPASQEFIFHNAVLLLGGKQKYSFGNFAPKVFYTFGIRAEYTFGTNLDEYKEFNEQFPIYPFEEGVRKYNYGPMIGGGMEFIFAELIGAVLEVTVNPDFSFQYKQPFIQTSKTNPYTGLPISIQENEIRNTTLEISLGLRFIRKIEYVD